MIQWTGASGPPIGMPHLSFVPRKPVPLGCELKCVADGTSGVMMYLELQEGKTRMMRLRFADEYPATVATTLRMVAAMGLGEKIYLLTTNYVALSSEIPGLPHALQLARCRKSSVSSSRAASKQPMLVFQSRQCAGSWRV